MNDSTPTIWLETAPGQRQPHRLAMGSAIVGRDRDADLSIASDFVSSHHAELYWDGERLRVRDLGSRNGTSVNDQPVVDWIDLRNGDEIRFGTIRGVVEAGSPEQVSEPTQPAVEARPSVVAGRRPSQIPVFISHASEDKREARTIATYLEAQGWSVWIDEAGIEGGKDWRGELIQALEETWVVLLLVSRHSMQSRWVIREVQAADRLGLQIIPVVIDDVPYPDPLRMVLSGVQQIDATGMGDSDRRAHQLDRIDTALVHAARRPGPSKPGRVRIFFGTVLGTLGVIGIIIAFGVFFYGAYAEMTSEPSFEPRVPLPFYAFPVFIVSMIVAGIGQGLRRSGLKKGI